MLSLMFNQFTSPLFFILILISFSAFSQEYSSFDTYVYSVRAGEALELDVYSSSKEMAPTLLFVHGGGFYSGTRKEANIDHFCDSVSKAGFTVVNLSYHLYLKGQSFHCDQPSAKKIKAFESAAQDIRSALHFLIENDSALYVERSALMLSGSSSGAEAVLQAAFAPYGEGKMELEELIPEFQFKAVMAFAGAMTDLHWINESNACPIMLYHGTCDDLVPYAYAAHHYCPDETVGALMLHGSYSIFEKYTSLNASIELVSACGGKHGSCIFPIEKEIDEVIQFMQKALAGEKFSKHRTRVVSSKPCKHPTHDPCQAEN
ncbi:MAG: dienelactone hydrolase [Flavobacteriales bacterium]|jgi:dienelactone hydrolase